MDIFGTGRSSAPNKNLLDLSHERKFSMKMADLVPILCEEVIPGDTFRMNTEIMVRLAPLVAPMMHRVNVYTHFFFVPNRLVWDDWERFITGGETGNQVEPVLPYVELSNENMALANVSGGLMDFLGYPVTYGQGVVGDSRVNALPLRAYHLIWNEWYRDQNLQGANEIPKKSGVEDADHLMYLQKRNWEKDYFTTCLPWAQKGGEVAIPGEFDGGNLDFTHGTINELRNATRLQRWLEKNARGGSRYIEQILSHFGVRSSDARLQRPEYLGGGKSPIVISEVQQTSQTTQGEDGSPQGNLAGHGIAVGNSHSFTKTFEEHGFVFGLVSVMPRTSYMDTCRRHVWKKDRFDFYWPEFANLGEQPVYKKELYDGLTGGPIPSDVFGYQPRYQEYKFIPSTVHGDFKTSLAFWHMARKFEGTPNLNSSFVTANPTKRVFAVEDPLVHELYVQVYNNLKATRPMPVYSNPSL